MPRYDAVGTLGCLRFTLERLWNVRGRNLAATRQDPQLFFCLRPPIKAGGEGFIFPQSLLFCLRLFVHIASINGAVLSRYGIVVLPPRPLPPSLPSFRRLEDFCLFVAVHLAHRLFFAKGGCTFCLFSSPSSVYVCVCSVYVAFVACGDMHVKRPARGLGVGHRHQDHGCRKREGRGAHQLRRQVSGVDVFGFSRRD